MVRPHLFAIGLVLLFAAGLAADGPTAGQTIAITGGHVRTQTDAGDFVGTVVIREGKIVAVGPDVAAPAGAKIIDAKNCVITPGLIDAHGSLGLHPSSAAETGRDANLNILDAIDPFTDDWRDAARQGITAVYVQPAGGGNLGGSGAVLRVCGGDCADDLALRSPAGLQISLGTPPPAPAAPTDQVAAFARQRGINIQIPTQPAAPPANTSLVRFQQYEQVRGQFSAAKQYGDAKQTKKEPAKELLLKAIKGEIPVFIEVHHEDDLRNALKLVNEFGLRALVEHVERTKPLPEELRTSRAALVIGTKPAGDIRQLALDGRRFAIGSYGTESRATAGLRLHAAAAVAAGLPRDAVLRALTADAADLLGLGAKLGRIAAGRPADLAVFAGDPLDASVPVRLAISQGTVTCDNPSAELSDEQRIAHDLNAAVQSLNRDAPPRSVTKNVPQRRVIAEPLSAETPHPVNERERLVSDLPSTLPTSYVLRSNRLLIGTGQFVPGEVAVIDGRVMASGEKSAKFPVFDLGDAPLTPGLVAAHVGLPGELTPDADAGHLRAADGLTADDSHVRSCRDAGFLSAVVAPGSTNVLAGLAGLVRGGSGDATDIGMKFVLTASARNSERYPISLAGQVELIDARLRGAESQSDLYLPAAVRTALLAQRDRNLAAVRDGKLVACFEAHTRAEIRAALRLTSEHKLRGVLLMPRDVEELADEIRAANVAVVIGPVRPQDAEPVVRGLIALGKAGVPLAFGGEAAELRPTAAWLVNLGLPRTAARRALLGQPAEALGLPAGTGRLQPGDAADFVVWTGDPLDPASRPAAVVANGHRLAIGDAGDGPTSDPRRPGTAPARTGRRGR